MSEIWSLWWLGESCYSQSPPACTYTLMGYGLLGNCQHTWNLQPKRALEVPRPLYIRAPGGRSCHGVRAVRAQCTLRVYPEPSR